MKRLFVILFVVAATTALAILLFWLASTFTDLHELLGIHGLIAICFGAAFPFVAFVKFLCEKKTVPPEKISAQKIELNDERNVTLTRHAASISWYVNFFALGIMLFLLGALGYGVPSAMGLIVLGINCFSFIFSLFVLKKKY
ncbi:MAG: hypothetical protein FWD19_04430 [Defluviitaleaceae bacterium]|nr:hypothetical protein [Defluviitaleaceae bacterium]